MNKSKFISFTASLVLAMVFTFSCSDDGGGNNNTSTCGGKEYDATVYTCEKGELVGFCRGNSYYPEYQYCDNNGEIKEGTEISSSSLSSVGGSSSSGSGGNENGGGGSVTYEGQTYKTVKIGTQTWLAKNLNNGVAGSKCYDNDPANCDKYGRLYDWATAMSLPPGCNENSCSSQIQSKHRGICPNGWHIPSNADWDKLMEFVGGISTAGTKLKAKSGWDGNGNGTDDYDFSALPGGLLGHWEDSDDSDCSDCSSGSDGGGSSGSDFYEIGNWGLWWSATEGDKDKEYGDYRRAYSRFMFSDDDDYHGSNSSVHSENGYYKQPLTSVRCLKD
jgi:uncharacterized protein (TIGR02145 family)